MAKFKKDGKRETPAISTASLPDIVFMLLFFFMVSTTMREVSLMVANAMPQATETVKLEKKSLVSNIYVGVSRHARRCGGAAYPASDREGKVSL